MTGLCLFGEMELGPDTDEVGVSDNRFVLEFDFSVALIKNEFTCGGVGGGPSKENVSDIILCRSPCCSAQSTLAIQCYSGRPQY